MTASTLARNISVAMFGSTCIALGSAAMEANSAQAALFSAPLTVSFTAGALAGEPAGGSVSWDSDFLTGSGVEVLDVNSGFKGLTFTLQGVTYNETNDLDFNLYPNLYFTNGVLTGLDYLFQVQGTPALLQFSDNFKVFYSSEPAGTYAFGSATAVPTPALLPSLIGLGVAALRKRKTEAAKEA